MRFGKMTCPDCDQSFEEIAALAALEGEIWDAETRYGGFRSFARPTVAGGLHPLKCPNCGMRLRQPLWPYSLMIAAFVLAWCLGMAAFINMLGGYFPGEVFRYPAWAVGFLFVSGIVFAVVASFRAKPIKCGRY